MNDPLIIKTVLQSCNNFFSSFFLLSSYAKFVQTLDIKVFFGVTTQTKKISSHHVCLSVHPSEFAILFLTVPGFWNCFFIPNIFIYIGTHKPPPPEPRWSIFYLPILPFDEEKNHVFGSIYYVLSGHTTDKTPYFLFSSLICVYVLY